MNYSLISNIMKKIILLLLTIIVFGSCCKQRMTAYDLTTEEKDLIPYLKNSTFKWQTSNDLILEGKVIDVTESKEYGGDGCEDYYFEQKKAILITEEYKHIVLVEKKGTEQTGLTMGTYNLDSSFTNFKHFDINTVHLNFSTITFNNETFTDAVRIDAYNEDRSVNSTLIYSKTHGIE